MPAYGAFAPLRLVAHDLACARGGRPVFAGVSFQLEAGRTLAVTGPNGAGKSSLLRLVAGLLRAESGSVALESEDEEEAPVHDLAHYLGHADALKPALTLAETLRFFAALYRQGEAVAEAELVACAGTVGLAHALDLHVGVLSAGQRRRAALARLMLAPRPLWLLDEPTAALDADGETLLGELMRGHLEARGLILAATHQTLPVTPDAALELRAA